MNKIKKLISLFTKNRGIVFSSEELKTKEKKEEEEGKPIPLLGLEDPVLPIMVRAETEFYHLKSLDDKKFYERQLNVVFYNNLVSSEEPIYVTLRKEYGVVKKGTSGYREETFLSVQGLILYPWTYSKDVNGKITKIFSLDASNYYLPGEINLEEYHHSYDDKYGNTWHDSQEVLQAEEVFSDKLLNIIGILNTDKLQVPETSIVDFSVEPLRNHNGKFVHCYRLKDKTCLSGSFEDSIFKLNQLAGVLNSRELELSEIEKKIAVMEIEKRLNFTKLVKYYEKYPKDTVSLKAVAIKMFESYLDSDMYSRNVEDKLSFLRLNFINVGLLKKKDIDSLIYIALKRVILNYKKELNSQLFDQLDYCNTENYLSEKIMSIINKSGIKSASIQNDLVCLFWKEIFCFSTVMNNFDKIPVEVKIRDAHYIVSSIPPLNGRGFGKDRIEKFWEIIASEITPFLKDEDIHSLMNRRPSQAPLFAAFLKKGKEKTFKKLLQKFIYEGNLNMVIFCCDQLGVEELPSPMDILKTSINRIDVPNKIWDHQFNFVSKKQITDVINFADRYLKQKKEKEDFFIFLLENFKDKLHPAQECFLFRKINKKIEINSFLNRHCNYQMVEKRTTVFCENNGGQRYPTYSEYCYENQINLFVDISDELDKVDRPEFLERVAAELLTFGKVIGWSTSSFLEKMPLSMKNKWAKIFFEKAISDYNQNYYENIMGSNPSGLLRLFSPSISSKKAEEIEYKGVGGLVYFFSLLYRNKKTSRKLIFDFLDRVEHYREGNYSYELPDILDGHLKVFFSTEQHSKYSEGEIFSMIKKIKNR